MRSLSTGLFPMWALATTSGSCVGNFWDCSVLSGMCQGRSFKSHVRWGWPWLNRHGAHVEDHHHLLSSPTGASVMVPRLHSSSSVLLYHATPVFPVFERSHSAFSKWLVFWPTKLMTKVEFHTNCFWSNLSKFGERLCILPVNFILQVGSISQQLPEYQ